jgi:hypothetical protein
MPELTLLIQSQFDGFKKKTDEFLGRAVWRPLWDVWEETEKKALDEVRQNILKWLAEHSEWFRFTSDEIVQSDWNQIQTNLANLTVLAARMFDLELAQIPTAAMFPAWGLEVKFENPFTFNFRCRAQMPACTAILPAWLIRNWWKRRLSKESPQIADKWQEAVIVYATENVLRSFNHLTDGIEVQASEIAGRIMACLRDVENASDNPQTNVEVLNRLRHELTELRGKLLSGDEFADRPRPGGQPNLSPMPSVFANASMSAAVEINFGSDLKTRGCAACEYLAKFTFRLLAQFQGELVDNESIRKNFAEKLGFCPFHLWQLESISSPIGVSLGFSDLADYVSKLFCEKAEEIRTHAHVRFVCDAAKCDCCNLLKVAERDYLQQLAGFVETSEGRAVYAASQGICLQHLRVWLPFLNEDTSRCVLGTTARVFGQLAEDMQSYGLKTETLRRELRNSDENDAYLRAVTHIAGAKNSCMPMNKEVEV